MLATIERTPTYPVNLSLGKAPAMLRFEDAHHAPDAGEEALGIQRDGLNVMNKVRAKYATGAQMTSSEMMALCDAFIQVSGVSGEGNIANITTSIRLPETISPFQSAESIGRRIAGIDAQVARFGRKMLFLIEADQINADAFLDKLATVPRLTNSEFFPKNEAIVLNEIQDDRAKEFASEQGNIFKGIMRGEVDPLRRAFQQDGKKSFVWGVKREGLIAITPDGKQQSILELETKDSTDQDTQDMLRTEREWLDGTKIGLERFAVKVCFDEFVIPCCVSSSVKQQQEVKSNHSDNIISLEEKIAERNTLEVDTSDNQRVAASGGGFVGGEHDSQTCSSCGKDKYKEDGCKCSSEHSKAA